MDRTWVSPEADKKHLHALCLDSRRPAHSRSLEVAFEAPLTGKQFFEHAQVIRRYLGLLRFYQPPL